MKNRLPNRLPLCLALSMLLLSAQSCITEQEVAGSIDNYKQVYKYGYDFDESPTGTDYGYNVALTIISSPGGMKSPTAPTSGYKPGHIRDKYMYASTTPGFTPADAAADGGGYQLMDHLRFFAGPEYIKKRVKDGGAKVNMDYLELPLQARYYHDIPKIKGSVFGGVGPYAAYGLGGKTKYTSGDKVKTFDKDDGFKRFDAGINASVGYKMPDSFSFEFRLEWGLANLSRQESNPITGDVKLHNRGMSLNVGYPLAKLMPKK